MKATYSLIDFFFIDNENLLAYHLVLTKVQEVINKKMDPNENDSLFVQIEDVKTN